MKTQEFNQERKITVSNEHGTFNFTSYADMLGNFSDIKNSEIWANAHNNIVFVAHRFDTTGKIVERFETNEEAESYAAQLNEYFAICEEYCVEEL